MDWDKFNIQASGCYLPPKSIINTEWRSSDKPPEFVSFDEQYKDTNNNGPIINSVVFIKMDTE